LVELFFIWFLDKFESFEFLMTEPVSFRMPGDDAKHTMMWGAVAVLIVGGLLLYWFVLRKPTDNNKATTYSPPTMGAGPSYPPHATAQASRDVADLFHQPRGISSLPAGTSDFQSEQLDSRYNPPVDREPYTDPRLQPYTQSAPSADLTDASFKNLLKKNQPFIVAFVSNGCGHCHAMLPAYKQAMGRTRVNLYIAEASGLSPQTLQSLNIAGYPTILKFTNARSKPQEFSGDRTTDNFIRFAA